MDFFAEYAIIIIRGKSLFGGKPRVRKHKKITIVYIFMIFFLFALALVTIVIPKILNVTPYVVEDNKMAPQYRKGGLVFVKNKERDIHVGDPITYYENQGNAIKTRRVLAVDDRLEGYFVKGDNTDKVEMGIVHKRNLIGRPYFYLPYIGILVDAQIMGVLKVSLFLLAVLMTFYALLVPASIHQFRQQTK